VSTVQSMEMGSYGSHHNSLFPGILFAKIQHVCCGVLSRAKVLRCLRALPFETPVQRDPEGFFTYSH